VVAAAGQGVRFESELPKQYVPLLGIPVLQRTLAALGSCSHVDALAVVVNPDEVDYWREEIAKGPLHKVVLVAAGGEERPLSVRNGLEALADMGSWDLVGVHDGARPLVTCDEVGRAVEALVADSSLEGVVLAIPCTDTIKTVNEEWFVTGTPDRRLLWRAQTPQIFRWQAIMDAYAEPEEVLLAATDDSSLVEGRGGKVAVVEGSPENFKITDQMDLRHAENILAERGR
jgi:2-C-methyl-D-erythritol 4-phosphate cytidylyltransferase